MRGQALDDAKLSLTQYANGVLAPRMIYGTTLRVGDSSTSIVLRDLAERPDILSVKVWGHRRNPGLGEPRTGEDRQEVPGRRRPRPGARDEGSDRRAQQTERRRGYGRGCPARRTTSSRSTRPSSPDNTRSWAPTRSTRTPSRWRPPSPTASARCGSRAPCSSPFSGCSSCCSPGTPRGCSAARRRISASAPPRSASPTACWRRAPSRRSRA